jgi:hypothetical protein
MNQAAMLSTISGIFIHSCSRASFMVLMEKHPLVFFLSYPALSIKHFSIAPFVVNANKLHTFI